MYDIFVSYSYSYSYYILIPNRVDGTDVWCGFRENSDDSVTTIAVKLMTVVLVVVVVLKCVTQKHVMMFYGKRRKYTLNAYMQLVLSRNCYAIFLIKITIVNIYGIMILLLCTCYGDWRTNPFLGLRDTRRLHTTMRRIEDVQKEAGWWHWLVSEHNKYKKKRNTNKNIQKTTRKELWDTTKYIIIYYYMYNKYHINIIIIIKPLTYNIHILLKSNRTIYLY